MGDCAQRTLLVANCSRDAFSGSSGRLVEVLERLKVSCCPVLSVLEQPRSAGGGCFVNDCETSSRLRAASGTPMIQVVIYSVESKVGMMIGKHRRHMGGVTDLDLQQ